MLARTLRSVPRVVSQRNAMGAVGSAAASNLAATKGKDFLLPFEKASTTKAVTHYTSYALAVGVPLAVASGAAVSSAIDIVMNLVIPVHMHIGMRSVIVDYVWDLKTQRAALAGLAVFTVLTAALLARMNFADAGMTNGILMLWQEPPAPEVD